MRIKLTSFANDHNPVYNGYANYALSQEDRQQIVTGVAAIVVVICTIRISTLRVRELNPCKIALSDELTNGWDCFWKSKAGQTLAFLWSLAVGASITLCAATVVQLNDGSKIPDFQAATTIASVRALSLVPLSFSFLFGQPAQHPPKAAYFSGVCSVLGFTTIIAISTFGYGIALTTQILGSLSTALAFDIYHKRSGGKVRLAGVVCVLIGVFLLFKSRAHRSENTHSVGPSNSRSLYHLICLFLVFFVGAGYAAQAHGTQLLTASLGNVFRSAFVCNLGTVACYALFIAFLQESPAFRFDDWWLWLLAVAQQIGYVSSMAVLPRVLSYATTFSAVVCGQVLSAAVVDVINEKWLLEPRRVLLLMSGMGLALSGSVLCAIFNTAPDERAMEGESKR